MKTQNTESNLLHHVVMSDLGLR